MAFFAPGNPPRTSTQGTFTNPSTSDLLAEISSLGGETNRPDVLYEARIIIGASTLCTAVIEHCLSTGLGSTALQTDGLKGQLGARTIYATVNQSAQYVLRFRGTTGDRVRVRLTAAITGTAAATLQIEALA